MKHQTRLLFLLLLVMALPAWGQVANISLLGQGVIEREYNEQAKDFLETGTFDIPTKVVLHGGYMAFKRGANDWLVNKVTYEGKTQLGDNIFDQYEDNYQQQILFSQSRETILFLIPSKEHKDQLFRVIAYTGLKRSSYVREEGMPYIREYERMEAQGQMPEASYASGTGETPREQEEQDDGRFRRDYQYIAYYNLETDTWSDWQQGSNTFLFNINDNGDFKLFTSEGKQILFRSTSEITEGKTDEGEPYQSMKALDAKGDEVTLILYSNPSIGLLLAWDEGVRVQFSE